MNSPDHRLCVLIAALSGRALAELARKAGYRPLVADLFGDMDTRGYAHAVRVVRGNLTEGFEPEDLLVALSELTQQCDLPPIGIVVGAGFEQQPAVLDELARHWRLLGCSADVVRAVKDPAQLARLCADLEIPHPAICLDPPPNPEAWLAKTVGGSGGWHISAANLRDPPANVYYQRRVTGEPISALVIGTGNAARIIGWSSQWSSPIPEAPYRWAGAVQPARIDPDLRAHLSDKALELTIAAGLGGIASMDFLVDRTIWHVLEINPRPGGTLDIFDDNSGRLFELHVAACSGSLIEPPHYCGAQACAIAFAERDIESMPEMQWPAWCADLQAAGTRIEHGAPICTIRVHADAPEDARRMVEERRRTLLQMVDAPELATC